MGGAFYVTPPVKWTAQELPPRCLHEMGANSVAEFKNGGAPLAAA
jgi:hypothetical protein